MKVLGMVNDVIQYLSEAIARIFGPRDDAYPETGVQPFSGDIPLVKDDSEQY